MKTRVRFAPSPTGPLHIGGLRTALYNYLYARKHDGVFVLRVEDTDQNRYVPESEQYIADCLAWCGIEPDEGPERGGPFGPYRQSERKPLYQDYIDLLLQKGEAYLAFDSSEALAEARLEAESRGTSFQYGASNRMQFKNSLSLDATSVAALKKTTPFVVRLKVHQGRTVSVFDEIRGTIAVNTNTIDDKILMKADGMPTYHFANVVDDHLMEISAVIRGEEWLPSLPLHQLLYDAFGWEVPKFMHLPLILKPTGKGKLSKRDGEKGGYPVFPLNWGTATTGFREQGFLPEGLINYLALLGWSDGEDKELFTLEELEKAFSVDRIQKGGARFDYEKATWINHQKIQQTDTPKLLGFENEYTNILIEKFGEEKAISVLDLVKDRLNTLNDLKENLSFFISEPEIDAKAIKKIKGKDPVSLLKVVEDALERGVRLGDLKTYCMEWAKKNDVGVGALMQSIRVAVVGKLAGPDLFLSIDILGKSVTLDRIKRTINHIETNT